jgi:hypothetical protein
MVSDNERMASGHTKLEHIQTRAKNQMLVVFLYENWMCFKKDTKEYRTFTTHKNRISLLMLDQPFKFLWF